MFWLLLLFYRWETYASLRQMACFGLRLRRRSSASARAVDSYAPGRPEFLPAPFLVILVTLLFNGRVGVFAGAALAILLGSQWALRDEHTLLFCLLGGTAAALGTRVARRRRELYVTILTVVAGLRRGRRSSWASSTAGSRSRWAGAWPAAR